MTYAHPVKSPTYLALTRILRMSSDRAPPGALKNEWDYLHKTLNLRLEVSS